MTRWWRSLCLAGAASAIAAVVHGQTAPAAPSAAKEPPPRLDVKAQLTVLVSTGNTQTETIGAGGEVTYRPAPWTHTARFVFLQKDDDDVLSARSFAGLFRTERHVSPRVAVFGQYDYLRDLFAGVEHRHTAAGGLSYALIDHKPHRLDLDGGLGYEHEDRIGEESSNSAIALAGTRYRWDFNANNALTDEFRVTLPFAHTSEWKIDHLVALSAQLTSLFSLRVSHAIRYSHEPVAGFESTDTIAAIAFVVAAKRAGP